MANLGTGFGPRVQDVPWNVEPQMRVPAATPLVTTVFASNTAVGRDGNGNMINMDDTQRALFTGIIRTVKKPSVDTTNTIQTNGLSGDNLFDIYTPTWININIAAAVAGQEGRKVYFLFNNQVQYSPGNNGNLAGVVWRVTSPTTVMVQCPWVAALNGFNSFVSLPSTGNVTLLKFDANKAFQITAIVNQTITLPSSQLCGSGDEIYFNVTGAGGGTYTIAAASGDTVQGGATYTLPSTAQYTRQVFICDPVSSRWLLE